MKEWLEPRFELYLLDEHCLDGYWSEEVDIDNDGLADPVGYGLGQGKVIWSWRRASQLRDYGLLCRRVLRGTASAGHSLLQSFCDADEASVMQTH
jgi:hypothetical protein